jgi:3-deoxy-D-manno-octulosonic-acid transferase
MYRKIFCFIAYNVFVVPFFIILAYMLLPFIKKIKMGIRGRSSMFKRLLDAQLDENAINKKIVWFHVASAGEFEQALPLISRLKKEYENSFIVVTFFSPSGYNFYKRQKFDFIDYADYSPMDTPVSVLRFLNIVRPDMLILTRYDIWPNMIWFSWITRVKIVMINGSLQKFSKRFTFLARIFYKSVYSCFKFIGTITNEDAERFRKALGSSTRIVPVGDTKYDRVIGRKKSSALDIDLKNILKRKVFIAASIWEEDEKYLFPTLRELFKGFKNDFSAIIVPHEPNASQIKRWEDFMNEMGVSFVRFSKLSSLALEIDSIIVDKVGMLAELYKVSNVAYVGGGFSRGGVHNILEPAIYGNATCFGPKYLNSYEAKVFVDDNISKSVSTPNDLKEYVLKLFNENLYLKEVGAKHIARVNDFCGSTSSYLSYIIDLID